MFELGLTLLCITHLWPTFAHFLISFVTGLSVHSSLTKKTVWQINLKEWWLFSETWVGPHSFSRCHCGFHKQSELLSCSPESSLHYVLIDGNSVKRGELVAILINPFISESSQMTVPPSTRSFAQWLWQQSLSRLCSSELWYVIFNL